MNVDAASGTLTAFITTERCGDQRDWVGDATYSFGHSKVHSRQLMDIYNP
jgi:hypothetical protein